LYSNTNYLWNLRQKKGILLAAHRGTFGANVINNTCLAFENAIQHKADIIEVDVILSKDGVFYAFHDGGEKLQLDMDGDIKEMLSQEIESYPFLNQLGLVTNQHVDRLDRVLQCFKGRCLFNIDRSWFYWKETIKYLEEKDMAGQILLKAPAEDEYLQILQDSGSQIMFMPIVRNMDDWKKVQKYKINLAAVELIFDSLESPLVAPEFIDSLHDMKLLTWVNAITLDDTYIMSAQLDDNHAIADGYEENWGRLADMGFDIIQTDWLALLKSFLSQRTIKK